VVEALELGWCIVGSDRGPELRPEAHDQVDAAHRRARLAERRDGRHQLLARSAVAEIELEIGMRCRPEREDPCLRGAHATTLVGSLEPVRRLA
jgi:hypothetical protein